MVVELRNVSIEIDKDVVRGVDAGAQFENNYENQNITPYVPHDALYGA